MLLQSVALSGIVIAIASFGQMLVSMRGVIENKLVSESTFMIVAGSVGLVALYYGALSIHRFHKAK